MYRRTSKYAKRREWHPRPAIAESDQRQPAWRPPQLRRRITIEDFDGADTLAEHDAQPAQAAQPVAPKEALHALAEEQARLGLGIDQAQPMGVPDGWVMVPIFPTDGMTSTGVAALSERGVELHDHFDCAYAYSRMLAAAPQPPAQPSADAENDLPGMWSASDFTGGDPDERSYAARAAEKGE